MAFMYKDNPQGKTFFFKF
jgi:hypothetical protein